MPSRLQQGLQDKGYEEWVGEMIGMREILRHFANVSRSDITGMRAPYLKPGRNTQYEVREDWRTRGARVGVGLGLPGLGSQDDHYSPYRGPSLTDFCE